MLKTLSTPRLRTRTFILLGVCGVLAVAAAVVGISDDPPGLLMAFLSACALVVAFVHPWKGARAFLRLFYVSVLGFIVFIVFHNVFGYLASRVDEPSLAHDLLDGAGVVFFTAATLLCLAGVLVGAVGAVVMSRREHPVSNEGVLTSGRA